jgi:hypothetical protein
MNPPRKRSGQQTGPRRIDGAMLDVHGAARLTGDTEKAVRAKIARGLLPYRRLGGRVVFLRSELLAFLEALPGVRLEEALANIEGRRAP